MSDRQILEKYVNLENACVDEAEKIHSYEDAV